MITLPSSVDDTLALLGRADYVADRSLATAVHLALHLNRPLFLEGEAGVGKTEIAKVLASVLRRRLIRLQCYEGLDVSTALYEWNYPRQMLEIRLLEARGEAELAVQQVSELVPVEGIELIGPFPPELQLITLFSAGMSPHAKNPAAARALLRFFADPAALAAIKAKGMDPP